MNKSQKEKIVDFCEQERSVKDIARRFKISIIKSSKMVLELLDQGKLKLTIGFHLVKR